MTSVAPESRLGSGSKKKLDKAREPNFQKKIGKNGHFFEKMNEQIAQFANNICNLKSFKSWKTNNTKERLLESFFKYRFQKIYFTYIHE